MMTEHAPAPATTEPYEKFAYLIAALVVALGGAMTLLFGLPGLAMTALALVPVMYILLILLSVGK